MLATSALVTRLSGSLGGMVWTRNRYGALICRARVTPVNVNSTFLEVRRSSFGQAVSAWKTLTTLQQEAWIDFAAGTPWTNKLGETVYLTGQAMYIGQVAFFLSLYPGASISTYNTAPCVPGMFPQPLLSFACCVSPDLGVIVSVQNLHDTKAMNCVVRISPPQSLGVRYYSGPYSSGNQIVLSAIAAGATDDAEFCDLCAAQYFFQCRALDAVEENKMSSMVHGSFVACTAAP